MGTGSMRWRMRCLFVAAGLVTAFIGTQTRRDAGVVKATVAPSMPRLSAVVHRTNGYQIGAYYFSGWAHGQNDNLSPMLTNSPLRRYEPLIGWYDDSQRQVDRTIAQAADAGIDFFAFDWYDVGRSPYLSDQKLDEGIGYYLRSTRRNRLNFCINFVDQEPFLPRPRDWPRLVRRWLAYFLQPDYVRVDGKPLFVVFNPERMRLIFKNSAGVHTALSYLRAQARKVGLPGVTVAVATRLTPTYNPGSVGRLVAEGYDVATGYNYHLLGGEKPGVAAPYAALVAENTALWDRIGQHVPLPYIPVVTSGWDQRFDQRQYRHAVFYSGRTSAAFACYAAAARRWIDDNPAQAVPERIALVYAWNEIGEGGAIIPNHTDGYAYTTALRAAFTSPLAPSC